MEKVSVYFAPNKVQAEIIKNTFSEKNINCRIKGDEQSGFEIVVDKDDEQAAMDCLESIGVLKDDLDDSETTQEKESLPKQFFKTAVFFIVVVTFFVLYVVGVDKIINVVKNALF